MGQADMGWVELCPPHPPEKQYIEVLTPHTGGCDLCGNRVFLDVIKLRSHRVGSNPITDGLLSHTLAR